jgi:DNA-binding transcriptional LysR family regulator
LKRIIDMKNILTKPTIDLRALYYFSVLAEEKHFSAAAKRIGIEQPPLSLQIKKLENLIGGELFDRSSRQITLTALGEALVPEALAVLERTDHLIESIRNIGRGEAGILNIGFATSTSFSGIPSVIQKHKKLYPKVELRLRELSSAAQINELLNGTIDIGFIREAGKQEGIICKEIVNEDFIAVVSNKHPLAKKEIIRMKDLNNEPFVHFPRHVAPALYDKVNDVFAAARFHPNIVQEALEWQTIISLVEANLGVSVCPASFHELKIGKVQYKPIADVKIKTSISICYHKESRSKLIQPFIELTKEHLSN